MTPSGESYALVTGMVAHHHYRGARHSIALSHVDGHALAAKRRVAGRDRHDGAGRSIDAKAEESFGHPWDQSSLSGRIIAGPHALKSSREAA